MQRIRYEPSYGHNIHTVCLTAEEAKLADSELVKLADGGNGCFGGEVLRRPGRISGAPYAQITVYTD